MSASHRDESSDSLFLPSHDPHYDNEQASRRRRMQARTERERSREVSRGLHYPGDGLDFRRPMMSSVARERSVSLAAAPAPVIDLTDEAEGGSEGFSGRRGDVHLRGASEAAPSDGPSRAGGSQRLPRFGRNVIDVDETNTDLPPPPNSSPQFGHTTTARDG